MTEKAPDVNEIAVACRKLAISMGAKTVIVMIGIPEAGVDCSYTCAGQKLHLRGLLEICNDKLRAWWAKPAQPAKADPAIEA